MTPPINIDGTNENYSNVTIDGQDVTQITIDGQDVLSAIPDSGVARLTFDDADTSSGSAIDVWNANDGTIQGATTGVAGINPNDSGQAYDFAGGSDRVDIPDVFSGRSAVTLAIWVQHDTKGRFHRLLGDAKNQFRAYHDHDSGWEFGVNGSLITQGSDTLSTNNANLFGLAYDSSGFGDGTTARFYKNDGTILFSGSPSSSSVGSGTQSLMCRPSGSAGTDGIADDPRIYSKGLTQTEFSNLYNTGSI